MKEKQFLAVFVREQVNGMVVLHGSQVYVNFWPLV